MGIGRPQVWPSGDTPINPKNNVDSVNSDWDDLIAVKKIDPVTNLRFGVLKEVYKPNVKYDMYRHDWNGSIPQQYNGNNPVVSSGSNPTSLAEVKYHVINADSGDVYICLKNGAGSGNAVSTISPWTGTNLEVSGADLGIRECSDGYIWKFVGNTSSSDVDKFSTGLFHPVKSLTTSVSIGDPYKPQWDVGTACQSHKGGIFAVLVSGGGSGYTVGTHTLNIKGNGTNCAGTVTVSSGGVVTNVRITNPGSGYTFAAIENPAGGSSATFDIIYSQSSGFVDAPDILNATYMMVATQVSSDNDPKFPTENEYRKISLILNPKSYSNLNLLFSQEMGYATYFVAGAATPNDGVYDSGAGKGLVVNSVTTPSAGKRMIRPKYTYNTSESPNYSELSSASASITSSSPPEVALYEGEIVYSEYRSQIARALNQTEEIKIVIEM
jgi:hypothetical protein